MEKRILALDVGERRIGVAVSGPLGVTAQGLDTIERTSLAGVIAQIIELVETYDVGHLLVGWPLDMDGGEGAATQRVGRFADAAAAALGLPLIKWDERMSSVAAERALIEGNVSRAERRGLVDKVAATLILQSYLDAHNRDDTSPG